jgi:ankyrin repeat protein
MAERREKEKARAESTARLRAIAKAAFLSHPAATPMDFERCWPQIRDELFRQHTIQLVTESGENVDDLTDAIQKTSTQSVLRLASTEQSRKSLNLLSSGDPAAVPVDHSQASVAHHAMAVISAARDGNVNRLKTLIEAGANVNLKNGEGWTALMTAALKGHYDVARLLVTAGASLEETNNSGWTALRFASSVGDLDMMRLLIDHGADLNSQDEKGWTILMQAADEGHLEAVKLLLARGADKDIRSLSHESALSIALRQGHAEVVKTLKRNASSGLKQFAH